MDILMRPEDSRIPDTSANSLRALDNLSFFAAALFAIFGARAILYLAELGWGPIDLGLVLTASGASGALTQFAVGDFVDTRRSKRFVVGLAAAVVATALLFLGFRPTLPVAFAAAISLGAAARVVGLAIRAITLGLVGYEALAARTGRNARFASIGTIASTALLGCISYVLSARDGFMLAALLWIPLLLTLTQIDGADIHFGRSCGARDVGSANPERIRRLALLEDQRLLMFAGCLFLFESADASILPLIAENLSKAGQPSSSLLLSVLVCIPELLISLLAPCIAKIANQWGRRPLLIIGLGVEPFRVMMLGVSTLPASLLVAQLLGGLTGASLSVIIALVIADITNTTGRFNLAQGLVGTTSGLGAAISTSASGLLIQWCGPRAGFAMLTVLSLIALGFTWAYMSETKPSST